MEITKIVTGVQHVGIPTKSMEKTIDFYKKLGFSIAYETVHNNARVIFFKLKDIVLETYEDASAKGVSGAIDHLALNVNDIEAAFQFAKDKHFNLLHDSIQSLPFWDNGVKFFTIEGPNGENVEFNQYL